jgi:glycosyltransferase involved in cell wall biosynthesis
VKKVVQDLTSGGIDWQREKWQSGLGSKFIHQGEKNAVKYADEVIVLSKGVQDYFKETYDRETHFIPNGVNRPQIREAKLITDHFGLEKDSYILFLGRLVPEKGIRYLVEAFKNVKTDKKLVIAGGSSDTDSFMHRRQLRRLWRCCYSTDAAITGGKCLDCRCISVICLAILKTEYDDEPLSAAQRFFFFR